MTKSLSQLKVDAAAIAANTRWFADRTAGGLLAVVKADAFGHGDVVRTVTRAGATWLGVATLDEAFRVRAVDANTPLICWLTSPSDDFDAAVRQRIDVAVPSAAHLHALAAAGRRAGVAARVHLHIDVGMGRDGTPVGEWSPLCSIARHHERTGAVDVVGIMGHLSSADLPGSPQTRIEGMVFANALRTAVRRGLRPRVRHLAATAAIITGAAKGHNLARIGAGLYGIDPSNTSDVLMPALELTTRVVHAHGARAHTGVGYGHDYVTAGPTRLALLPLGYADGLPRSAAGRAEVLIRGRRRPLVGRFSMDMVVVDTGTDSVQPGEPVTVFGTGDDGAPTVTEWARWAGTIPHEIVTGIGTRVTRVPNVDVPSATERPAPVPHREKVAHGSLA
ncbi:alanine racemase [Planctomonas psychrotolerans]|uniref:alanine racemase n=1 Tax=Planctomonas psychrotolerans TaxID=2528712 RepID=UPI00123C15AB|nr:alanine racemase [Planctomonas psychrotolerans]